MNGRSGRKEDVDAAEDGVINRNYSPSPPFISLMGPHRTQKRPAAFPHPLVHHTQQHFYDQSHTLNKSRLYFRGIVGKSSTSYAPLSAKQGKTVRKSVQAE